MKMLQQNSLSAELKLDNLDADSAYFSLKLTNKAGHKFPSGYPSRRAFVEFVVTSELGDTLFQSGVLQSDYEVKGQNEGIEPHYDLIHSEDQVQIYELAPGNVNGEFTTILEQAHTALKDNRIVPLGFSTSHFAYDTTAIVGKASTDENFNHENNMEGSGTDVIHYHFPLNGYTGLIDVSAKVFYQSIPPRWINPLLDDVTPEIDTFRMMYENADRSPILITSEKIDSLFVQGVGTKDILEAKWLTVFPNPTNDGWVFISKPESVDIIVIKIYDAAGRLVKEVVNDFDKIQLPNNHNLYLIDIQTDKGRVIRKILRKN
ncbi:MAG TPA: T9SS type A sorting domain-containing protein [Phaeodactylibacter sp.]|nr:T9SS type A sorting domain-containing protein [Phaeodactylibacter sp.]